MTWRAISRLNGVRVLAAFRAAPRNSRAGARLLSGQDFDAQRQSDLVQIEQRIGWIEGMTGAEIARQREYLDYLVRISQR